ncbi:MAG: hypothetical protein M1820_009408 [Bogoriella megaspora]|nr:MAG: hypothetical protein M1820_009408 [Bogoriella megaspora]
MKRQRSQALHPAAASATPARVAKSKSKVTDITDTLESQSEGSRYSLRKRRRSTSEVQCGEYTEDHFEDDDSSPPTKVRALESGTTQKPLRQVKNYTCRICCEEVKASSFPRKGVVPESCVTCLTGENRICKPCIESSLRAQFDERDIEKMGCPSCNNPWDYTSLSKFLPREVLLRIDKAIVNRVVARESLSSTWRWCPCKGCNYGQIQEITIYMPRDAEWCNMVHCYGCRHSYCFHHQIPWHNGLTCTQYDYRQKHERAKNGITEEDMEKQDEEALKLMQKQETRICPYCGHGVQKTYGCDNMNCKSSLAILENIGSICGEQFNLAKAKKVEVKPARTRDYDLRKRTKIQYGP